MNKEHNPINRQLQKMYELWKNTVDDNTLFACWVLPKDDKAMYEMFCRLECSQHSMLEDITIVVQAPFNNIDNFSTDVAGGIIRNFQQQQDELRKLGFDRQWPESEILEEKLKNKQQRPEILNQTLASFRNAMGFEDHRWLNLALYPYTVFNGMQYSKWLMDILKSGLPPKCRIVALDYLEDMHLSRVGNKLPDICKNLPITLDLNGAMRQIATSGEPNDPETAFRKCLFEMGDGVKEKNKNKVIKWGERSIEIARSSGIKSMQGIAFTSFGGMLLSFKGNENKAEELLANAIKVTKPAADNGDDSCKHLLVQAYASLAACFVHQKNRQKAIDTYQMQGEYAQNEGFFGQAMEAYRQAAYYAGIVRKGEYGHFLSLAWQAGLKLDKNGQEFSGFRFVAYHYLVFLRTRGQKAEADEIDNKMVELLGGEWQNQVEEQNSNQKKVPGSMYS